MQRISIGQIELQVLVQGAGPPLLLVHGFPLDHSMWTRQIDSLSSQFQIIAPDLRGFGGSDVTTDTVTMHQLADDLAALLDELGIREPVTLCGLSMGGYIAWQFWQRHGQRLGRLILCDTRAISDTDDVVRFRLDAAERVVAEGTGFLVESMIDKLFAPTTLDQRQEVVESTRRVIQATQPAGIAAALRGMAQRPDVSSLLPSVSMPTLVICGSDDAITTVGEMKEIADAIPDARFVEVPEAGHMSPLENPIAVNQAIREFMAE